MWSSRPTFQWLRARRPAALEQEFAAEFTPACLDESQSMLVVLDEAVSIIDAVDPLVARWGEGRSQDARESLQLQIHLARLQGWLLDLHCCPEHDGIREDSLKLLDFYLTMLRYLHTVRRPAPRAAGADEPGSRRSLQVDGLGSPADRLIALRDTLGTVLAERRTLR
jgi:hypothetical protein